MRAFKHCTVLILTLLMSQLAVSQYSEYDWEERDTWMDVNAIFDTVGIQSGSFVADIGCHEGYLSIHLAKRVGATGQIFSVDVREDRLEKLEGNLEERKLTNVNVIHGDYDNPKLPRAALDVVIIMDTYHEMTSYETILDHVHKALKTGGKIVIIEKLKTRIKGKSREAQVDAHSLSTKYVAKELKAAGFTVVHTNEDMGEWENDEDKVIWMLVATKS